MFREWTVWLFAKFHWWKMWDLQYKSHWRFLWWMCTRLFFAWWNLSRWIVFSEVLTSLTSSLYLHFRLFFKECNCQNETTVQCEIDGTCSCIVGYGGKTCSDCAAFYYKVDGICTGTKATCKGNCIVLWLVSFLQNVHVESLEQSYVKAMAHVYANLCTMVLIATNVRKAILKMKVVFAA